MRARWRPGAAAACQQRGQPCRARPRNPARRRERAASRERVLQQLCDRTQSSLARPGSRALDAEAGRPEHALLEHLGRRIRLGIGLGRVTREAVGERHQRGGVLAASSGRRARGSRRCPAADAGAASTRTRCSRARPRRARAAAPSHGSPRSRASRAARPSAASRGSSPRARTPGRCRARGGTASWPPAPAAAADGGAGR